MICIKTDHSGSLITASCQFGCGAGRCTHVLTDPASKLFKVSALFATTSTLGHCSLYLGCTRAALPLKTLLQGSPIDISAFSISLLKKFQMLSILPYVAPASVLFFLFSERQVVIADVCGELLWLWAMP